MIDSRTRQFVNNYRIIAALVVVASHVFYVFSGNTYSVLNHVISFLAVLGFFIVSGYVNAASLSLKSDQQFVWARVKRLLPLYYLSVGLGFLAMFIAGKTILPEDFGALFFLQHWTGLQVMEGNGALWTLPYEMLLYLLLVSERRWPLSKYLAITALVLLGIATQSPYGIIFYIAFQAGVAAWDLKKSYPVHWPSGFETLNRWGKRSYELYVLHFPVVLIAFFYIDQQH